MKSVFSTRYVVAVLLNLVMLSGIAGAEGNAYDRPFLKGFVDRVMASMIDHDPSVLPLSGDYAATENSQPAELGMMSLWRTVTGVKQTGGGCH